MKKRLILFWGILCIVCLVSAGCDKKADRRTAGTGGGGVNSEDTTKKSEVVGTADFQITVSEGFTGRAVKLSDDVIMGNEPGGEQKAEEGDADMVVVNYTDIETMPRGASYFKLMKLENEKTKIREIAEEAAGIDTEGKLEKDLWESTIGELWPEITSDQLKDLPVYCVTTDVKDNEFMIEHYFFRVEDKNMLMGILYPRDDKSARKDMMDQFLGFELK